LEQNPIKTSGTEQTQREITVADVIISIAGRIIQKSKEQNQQLEKILSKPINHQKNGGK